MNESDVTDPEKFSFSTSFACERRSIQMILQQWRLYPSNLDVAYRRLYVEIQSVQLR